jgi:Tetratricopeptide repeat
VSRPDLRDPHSRRRFLSGGDDSLVSVARNLAFALATTSGAAIGVVTGNPAVGMAGTVLAGLLGNLWTSELTEQRGRHLRGVRYAHPNHDLAKLVGDAIARTFFDHAAENPTHARWLRRLAKAAERSYLEIAVHPAFPQVSSENLPALFQAAAGVGDRSSITMLEETVTAEGRDRTAASILVELLCSDWRRRPPEAAMTAAEQAIVHGLFASIREMFKRDFEGDGRAYAALAIDMTSQALALLARVSSDQAEVLREQRVEHEQLQATRDELIRLFESQRNDLERTQAQSMSSLLSEFATVRDQCDQILLSLLAVRRTQADHSREHADILRLLQEINERQKQQISQRAVQTLPSPIPALTDSERSVLDRARQSEDALTQAAAALLQRDFAAVDRILTDESSDRGDVTPRSRGPIEESLTDQAVRYYTILGDRWLFADEFDRAIAPYEKALALRPDEPTSRNNAAVAHTFARLGSIAAHRQRAIEIHVGTLEITEPGSADWAMTQNNLGNAWAGMLTGDRGENLRKAIAAYEAALTVYTKTAHPVDWAGTQTNLGGAWRDLPTGDRGENLRQAIAACEAALTVRTKAAYPVEWAGTQNNLGNAWRDMPADDQGENLRKAIAAYEAVLTVYTKTAQAAQWAGAQNNLGNAWRDMPMGDRGENLRKAIAACEAALTVYTRTAHPAQWAATQNNLGNAWRNMPTGDRGENLDQAIAAYEAALTVYTRTAHPDQWAGTQTNLGNAWRSVPTGNRGENLRKAIAACEAALTVYTRTAHSGRWAVTQNYLGNAWRDMPTGDRAENLRKAIAAYEAALTVYSKAERPFGWAMTQNNLATAWREMPTGDRAENLHRAIAACEAALTFYTRTAHPEQWAGTQNNLGNAWSDLPAGDRGENLHHAIAAYEAALTVYTKATLPVDWALTQNNLGAAWSDLRTGDQEENLRKAIDAYQAALTVYTKAAYPAQWAMTQNNLGNAWREVPTGDRGENLSKAIAAYEAALTVYARAAHPARWGSVQSNLSIALAGMAELPGEDACDWLARAIASGKGALRVLTAEAARGLRQQVMANLRTDREAYESLGCGERRPFDQIDPAS